MVTPQEAEAIANKAVESFINACGPRNIEDVGHVLIKLCSMTALALCAARGQDGGVQAVLSVAEHISQPKYAKASFKPVEKH
ncbi:hypothetical protein [Pseudomonas monteilii]|uniref:hypothetical protein n=1 Tax=Pseudomonas monteilii TaxID=76759 RepID=UPI001E299D2E|nr:hypothetical protein [Pseudomonas monteilii]MCE1010183.1 hypothetical protein [Pseudomonas monteilii]